jgi:hypothetical protein
MRAIFWWAKSLLTTSLVLGAVALSACGGGGGSSGGDADGGDDSGSGSGGGTTIPPPVAGCDASKTSAFRAINGISDSSSVEAILPDTSTDISGVAFASASPFQQTTICDYKVTLRVSDASGAHDVFVPDVGVAADAQTNLYATGTIADTKAMGFAVVRPIVAVPAGEVEIQLVHAASLSPALNVYALPPSSSAIADGRKIADAFGEQGFQYTAHTDAANLPAGSYRLIVTTLDGTQVYDSGPVGITLPAASGAISYQLAVFDAPGAPNGAPISLLMLDDSGAQTPLLNGAQ